MRGDYAGMKELVWSSDEEIESNQDLGEIDFSDSEDEKEEFEVKSKDHEVQNSAKELMHFVGIFLMVKKEEERKKEKEKEGNEIEFDVNPLGTESQQEIAVGKPESSFQRTTRRRMKLKRGITMDSGSHHNVMPRKMVRKGKIRPSEFSKKGIHYVAANKGQVPNAGETTFEFEIQEGSMEYWDFQIAEVNKALASIADRVDNNNRVVFDKDEKTGRDASYIFNKTTKKIIKMTRVCNVWKVDAIVDPEDTESESRGRG